MLFTCPAPSSLNTKTNIVTNTAKNISATLLLIELFDCNFPYIDGIKVGEMKND